MFSRFSLWYQINSFLIRYNMMACAVDNLIDALQGKIEKNCVNPQAAG
ncbi:hypothetical protein A9G84_000177 [Salmonella enterica subsp. enterica serovar Agoueve]|nr:hypothetical protein [Salmonella enterica subsp. enterica serovar Agoueve]